MQSFQEKTALLNFRVYLIEDYGQSWEEHNADRNVPGKDQSQDSGPIRL